MDINKIKFKGKRIDNGKWVEGDLISHNGYYVSDSTDCFNSMYEVIPETIICDYINNKDKQIEELKAENKKISNFNKLAIEEQINILLAKFWLTHTNDRVFDTFKCNYVPNQVYQNKARDIIGVNTLELNKIFNIENIDLNKLANKMKMTGLE